MARPEKKIEEKRSLRVDIRLTPAEQDRLFTQARGQGLSVSDFIRLSVLNSPPVQSRVNPDRVALITGLGQLGKIGSNLNQIALELHRERITGRYNQVSGERVAAAMTDLKNLSDHLLTILQGGHER